MNANNILDITSIHTIALENFIREKFGGTCYFNCLRVANGSTFMCKVSVYDYIHLYLFLFSQHIFFSF